MSANANRSLLESSSWAGTKEAVKKQESEAREQEERIKEAQRLLEVRAAEIPEQLSVLKKDLEEFVNTDVNEDTNEDGFAGEDGLMSDPLETLRQWQGGKVNLDKEELREAEKEKELKEAKKEKGKKKRQRGRRGND